MAALALALGAGVTTAGASSAHGSSVGQSAHHPSKHQLSVALHALMGYPKFTPPGPRLDAKKLPHSTEVVVIDNAPAVGPLEQAAAAAIAAAHAAGLKVKLLNGGANNTASDDNNLLEQGVNLRPAAVLQVGILPQLETGALKYASAHHVPVIAVDGDPIVVGAPGYGNGRYVAGAAEGDQAGIGKALAEYVALHGPSNATIGMITSNDIQNSGAVEKAFLSELHSACPHCSVVASENVDSADWTTETTSTVTSMLDAHPTMNYLFPVLDGLAPWVTSGLTAVSHRPTVISANATPGVAMKSVASGLFSAEAGNSPAITGWYAIDEALRVLLHVHGQTKPQEPVTFFTTAEMKAKHLNSNSAKSMFGTGFEAAFKKLWGLG